MNAPVRSVLDTRELSSERQYYKLQTACRVCGGALSDPLLDMGDMPLANALEPTAIQSINVPRYPLAIVLCPRCTLVQLSVSVNPDVLFRNYTYCSSYSQSYLHHCQDLATEIVSEFKLTERSLVLEAGCNDGCLLRYYVEQGIPVLGIDPARNLVTQLINDLSIPVVPEYFSEELAIELATQGKRADVFHAHNVLAHAGDLNGFMRGVRAILKPTGVAIFEVPYVLDLINRCEYDTIYHEHQSYFSLTALCNLLSRNGLVAVDVKRISTHGGSLRVFAKISGATSSRINELLSVEQNQGVGLVYPYREFAGEVEANRDDLIRILTEYKTNGCRIAGYAASAKAAILLNYASIDHTTIDYIVDKNDQKQGCYLPGVGIPIRPPELLLSDAPDVTIILAWNIAGEIATQQQDYIRNGGSLLVPIPTPTVLSEVC